MQQAAALICRMIEDSLTDPERVRKFERYQLAQDVFDDKTILSHIEIAPDIEPYGIPQTRKQVKGAIRMVAGSFDGADPYYVFKGGSQEAPSELREARENDTQLALETDQYTEHVRETARLAAIWCRGPFRVTWEERRKGEGWINSALVPEGDMEFVGPHRETIMPGDFVPYPLSAKQLVRCRLVGHRFDLPMSTIWQRQDDAEYFDKENVEVAALHEQTGPATENKDFRPNLYSVLVKLPPGMDDSKPLEPYRCTVVKSQITMLSMEESDKPLDYFAPGYEFDPKEVYATHSLASSMFEPQTMLNDAQTIRMLAGIAASKRLTFITGYTGEPVTSSPYMLGDTVYLRGAAKVQSVDTSSPSDRDLASLAEEARKDAQGVTGFSEVAAGQLPEASQSATATSGALAGTADEGEEKRRNFFAEEIRYVQYVQLLIYRNFQAFKRFHRDRLKTTKASDWKPQFTIAPNGLGPSNNPELTIRKLDTLAGAFQKLGIPWLEDVEAGTAPNIGVAVSKKELAKAIEQNLDLPMNTEKIIVDTTSIAAPPPVQPPIGGGAGGFPQGGGPDAILGPAGNGGIPPELLALLAGGQPPGIPPPMALAPPGGQYGLPGLPVGVGAGLPGGIPLA